MTTEIEPPFISVAQPEALGRHLENETLQLQLFRSVVVDGWATRNFLGGKLTFWGWQGGKVVQLFPIGWRHVPRLTPGERLFLAGPGDDLGGLRT